MRTQARYAKHQKAYLHLRAAAPHQKAYFYEVTLPYVVQTGPSLREDADPGEQTLNHTDTTLEVTLTTDTRTDTTLTGGMYV